MKILESILSWLPGLSQSELLLIQTRLSILLESSAEKRYAEVAEIHGILWETVDRLNLAPFSVLMRSSRGKQFRTGATALQLFVDESFPGIGKLQRRRVLMVLVRCVLDYQEAHHLPKSITSISSTFGRIREVVEESFPGYMRCGLLFEALTK